MEIFHTEIVVEKDGNLPLEHLPFFEGEAVHVYVSSAARTPGQGLVGSVLEYDQPLAPLAEADWEAAK